MKKLFLYSLMLMGVVLGFTSCGDDELTDSRITHFTQLELKGSEVFTVKVGETFTDPGFTATENGEDVSSKVVVTGATVDTSKPGVSYITYSVVNVDGFSVTKKRTVFVVDPDNFASAYLGESQYGKLHYYNAPIIIEQLEGNRYSISDILGGFYAYGRYPQYLGVLDLLLEAVIQLNDDNTIEIVEFGDWYFGSDMPSLIDGSYNPQTGTIKLNLDFGDPFTVILTK